MFHLLVSLALFVVVVLLGLFLIVTSDIPSWRQYQLLKNIPGPRGYYLLGNALELGSIKPNDLLEWFLTQLHTYPRMAKFWLFGQTFIMLKEPDDVQVLLSSTVHTIKGTDYNTVLPWLQEGLLTSNGEKWHSRRKLLTNSFHFKILEDSMGVFNKHCDQLCSKLKESRGQPLDIEHYLSMCALDVICESAMGFDLGAQTEEGHDYVTALKRVSQICVERVRKAWLLKDSVFRLSSMGQQFYKLLNGLHEFTDRVISERKESYISSTEGNVPQKGKIKLAFLDTLLEVEKRNPGTLSSSDMREEVDTFMFEGHDTTSAALNFFFFLIGRHPDIQDRVYRELEEIFDGDMEREVTLKDLQKMTYLECTLKESLRIYPSVPYISRLLKEDLELDGVTIPAGCNVAVLPYYIHKYEKYWTEPEKFDPSRFESTSAKERHPFSYIPFSAGPRNCIGQKFAMMELKMVAATVLRQFLVQTTTKPEEIKVVLQLVSRTATPIMCKFIPRSEIY